MQITAAREDRTQSTSWSLPLFLLRRWLRGRRALLFSHPDDFANYGFEVDRWIEQVKETFQAESIAVLAVGPRAADNQAGWIVASGGCFISQRTFDSIVDCRPERRFVMVLDGALQLRRTFLYSSEDCLPSPIGLAVWARARLGRDPHS
jgi:hypothetical protein